MARTVHRLDRQHGLALLAVLLALVDLGDEHVLAVVLPVARGLPELAVDQQRRLHLVVAGVLELAPHIVFQRAVQGPALRMPEHLAHRLVLDMEQVERAAELAVVALLGLLDHLQIGLEFVLGGEGHAVDALQLGVVRIAAPVGPGHLGQLECGAELAGRRQMRPQAHVEPVLALPVDRQLLIRRQAVADPLRLEHLAGLLEMPDRDFMRPHLAGDRQVALDDLAHLLLDLFEVGFGERQFARKVVVEAHLGRRAEGDLRPGKQLLHRLRQHVRRVVADDLQRLRLVAGDDADRRVAVDRTRQIPQLAVDFDDRGLLGQAGRNALRDRKAGDGFVERLLVAVREGDFNRHVLISLLSGFRFCCVRS